MRNFKSRITKLEQLNGSNREEITALLDGENLSIFERIGILYDAGIITGQMIADCIKEGSRKQLEDKNE